MTFLARLPAAIVDAARQFVQRRVAAVREIVALVRQVAGRKRPSPLDRERLASLWLDGGVSFSAPLAPTAQWPRRNVTLLVQRDGDAVLSLPDDIGEDATDRQRARDALAEAKAAMAAMWAAGPAAWIAVCQVGFEATGLGAVAYWWGSWGAGAVAADTASWLVPLLGTIGPALLWLGARYGARRLGGWVLARAIGKLRAPS